MSKLLLLAVVLFISGCSSNTSSETTENMNSKSETTEKMDSNVSGSQGKRITMAQAVDIAVKHLQTQKLLSPDYLVDVSNMKKPGEPWMVTVTAIPGNPGGHVSVYINEDGSVGDTRLGQ